MNEHFAAARFIAVSEMLRRIKETYRRDTEVSELTAAGSISMPLASGSRGTSLTAGRSIGRI